MLKISYAGCLGLLPVISAQFIQKCASQPEIAKKFTKNPDFWHSMSFKVINVGTTGNLVSSACYDKQEVCVYLQPFSC